MSKKMKKDFAERQKIKEEARLLGKESVGIDESSKLKRGDDYRGKIIHDKDRFQDKIHEKISNRNSENELTQGSSKKNAKYTKNIADNEDMSVLKENKDKIQGSPIGDYENESFKKFDENGKDLLSNGGRVYMLVTTADSVQAAQEKIYAQLDKQDTAGLFYRTDIGSKALEK